MISSLNRRQLWFAPLALAAFFIFGATIAQAVPIYGLTTTNQLVRFESNNPGTITLTQTITGL
ncbi:MAG: hypothetical protein ABIP75_01085, partial [Pyrinomonadaceae bacterium]